MTLSVALWDGCGALNDTKEVFADVPLELLLVPRSFGQREQLSLSRLKLRDGKGRELRLRG